MAVARAPNRPQRNVPFVGPDGRLSELGFQVLDQLWRQVVAGYVTVPCTATGKNVITLAPMLHREGGAILADHMAFSFKADQTSDGPVTIILADQAERKAYDDDGASQAGAGDTVAGCLYVAYYLSSLDGAAGGFVLK